MAPKVIVRASEFHKVEWIMEPVPPGSILWQPPKEAFGTAKELSKKVHVRVPCRSNFTLLDFTRISPSGEKTLCEAGSVSFGVDLFAHAEVELLDSPGILIVDGSTRPVLVKHAALLLKRILDYNGGFRIKAWDHGFHHVGLGSTAALQDAVAYAINLVS